jgi:hypothetical protein
MALSPNVKTFINFLEKEWAVEPVTLENLSTLVDKFQLEYPYDETKDILPYWCAEDAKTAAGMCKPGMTLSDDDAEIVLEHAADKFDANLGINWDILQFHIQYLLDIEEITLISDPDYVLEGSEDF